MSARDRSEKGEQQDDSEILKRLLANGAGELPKLFDRLRPSLKSMIGVRLDPRLKPRVDESDIVQETYLRAASSLGTYLESPNVHPVVWLRLIAKHLVAETHRRHFRLKRSPLLEVQFSSESSERLVSRIAASLQPVHSKLANEELVQRVREIFVLLRDGDREVLEMRHTEGMSIQEIAELLDSNYEATKKRYYRALARFRIEAKSLIEEDSGIKVTRDGQLKR